MGLRSHFECCTTLSFIRSPGKSNCLLDLRDVDIEQKLTGLQLPRRFQISIFEDNSNPFKALQKRLKEIKQIFGRIIDGYKLTIDLEKVYHIYQSRVLNVQHLCQEIVDCLANPNPSNAIINQFKRAIEAKKNYDEKLKIISGWVKEKKMYFLPEDGQVFVDFQFSILIIADALKSADQAFNTYYDGCLRYLMR